MERYILGSVQGQELRGCCSDRTGSVVLLEDKKRFKMIIDVRCVICENGAGEDVEHLLVTWEI